MKAITEFNVFNLKRAIALKAELAGQGKSPEEIQTSLGESFKLEGDKLTAFVNSLDLVNEKTDGLKRVMVVSFAEGEAVPGTVQKVGEQHFMLDYFQAPRPAAKPEEGKGKGKGRGRDRNPPRKNNRPGDKAANAAAAAHGSADGRAGKTEDTPTENQ